MKVKNLKRKKFKKRGFNQLEPILEKADINDYNYLDSLLETSSISQKEYDYYYQISKCELLKSEVEEIIEYLKQNQRDNIKGGFNYQQTDIKYKLKKLKDED